MILHTDRYFEHQYDVKRDMVCVKWPDIEDLFLPEIYNSISKLVENVRNYNIRNLLIDASQARLLTSFEEADKVVEFLLNGLKSSRLEKLARVESGNLDRENYLRSNLAAFNAGSRFEIRFFTDTTSALGWLSEDSVARQMQVTSLS